MVTTSKTSYKIKEALFGNHVKFKAKKFCSAAPLLVMAPTCDTHKFFGLNAFLDFMTVHYIVKHSKLQRLCYNCFTKSRSESIVFNFFFFFFFKSPCPGSLSLHCLSWPLRSPASHPTTSYGACKNSWVNVRTATHISPCHLLAITQWLSL